jgi:hypothetical protein
MNAGGPEGEIQSLSSNLIGFESNPTGQATGYIVDMGQTIGYVGGQIGGSIGNPATTFLQVVLNGNSVITAFPMIP